MPNLACWRSPWIIGWPGEHTYGFAERLAADAPEIEAQIRTTHP